MQDNGIFLRIFKVASSKSSSQDSKRLVEDSFFENSISRKVSHLRLLNEKLLCFLYLCNLLMCEEIIFIS